MEDSPNPFAQISPWVHSLEHGIIYGWTGNPVYVPDGFVICDGSNGTPDLRDRFIVGALSTYGVGEKNGVTVHVHTFRSDSHMHTRPAGDVVQSGTARDKDANLRIDTGTTDPADHTPPFYALCFLMKL